MIPNESILLRVAEALSRDVGRGIARLDPQDMAGIGADIGDIMEILGKRHTAAKAMPTFPEDRGRKLLQIDGIIRRNAQVGLDERVGVRIVSPKTAEKVVLSPVSQSFRPEIDGDAAFIGRLIEGIPVVAGDMVRVNFFSSLFREFKVLDTLPRGIVVIASSTSITISDHGASETAEPKITYEDIGGLGKEIQKIREMIELPLRYPEVFERLGIEAPKGILLHGAPGTGKTLIARAVANETNAYFIHVNGPEIIHKYYGESEARLREIFENARKNAPSIVFLDEIDAIAPKREEVTGEVEKRVVAQLLALLDGLEQRGQVVVIGATNIPNALDPALRRPGRFDREIRIKVPDKKGRSEILQIHTRGMPLAPDVDLEKLASITHGFVGADLGALCKEAGMLALRRILPKIEFKFERVPDEVLAELYVCMSDFLEALKEVEPSTTREVFVEVADVKWDDIGGLETIKQELIQAIEWPLKYPDIFEYTGVKPPRGILLYGPPGTGKTLLARAIATESEVNFISVKGPELLSKWVGESEKGVREVFAKAKQAAPCIIFLDEIDALAPRRGKEGDSGVGDRVMSQLLTEIDGVENLTGVIVIGATNRIDMLDPALLRPGRLEIHLELPFPSEADRLAILKVHTRGKPMDGTIDLKHLASVTKDLTGADIEALCRRASMLAIKDFIEAYVDTGADLYRGASQRKAGYDKLRIGVRHFEEALEWVCSRRRGLR